VPVAEDTFKLQFAISREFRDEICEAQDLLRHRIPDGDIATVFRTTSMPFVFSAALTTSTPRTRSMAARS